MRRLALMAVLWGFLAAGVRIAAAETAQEAGRRQYLMRVLAESTAPRVRAQAALSLAGWAQHPEVWRGLGKALRDSDVAVRLAAAAALRRSASQGPVPALLAARSDASAAVRREVEATLKALQTEASGGSASDSTATAARPAMQEVSPEARYYVGVGQPAAASPALVNASMLTRLQQLILRDLGLMRDVIVAPRNETGPAAQSVMQKHSLVGYQVDSAVVELREHADGVRAAVSLVLGTYPGRDIKAMLRGSAMVPGGRGEEAQQMALEGALRSAMQRLPQAMRAADAGYRAQK